MNDNHFYIKPDTDNIEAVLTGDVVKVSNESEQELLRNNYFKIDNSIGFILSSGLCRKAESHIRNRGDLKRFKLQEDWEPDQSAMFVGSQIHLLIETKGASFDKLRYKSMLEQPITPVKPDLPISTDSLNIAVSYLLNKSRMSFEEAYWKIKDNKAVRAIPEDFWWRKIDVEDKRFISLAKLATKEYEKIEPYLDTLEQYVDELIQYTEALNVLEDEYLLWRNDLDIILIDDLYDSWNKKSKTPEQMYETIKEIHDADFTELYELLDTCNNVYHEYVVVGYIDDVPVKVMTDILLDFGDKLIVIDVKTTYESVKTYHKAYRKYNIGSQISLYAKVISQHFGKPVEAAIFAISTTWKNSKLFYVSDIDLQVSYEGGWNKPYFTNFRDTSHKTYLETLILNEHKYLWENQPIMSLSDIQEKIGIVQVLSHLKKSLMI